MASDTEVQRNGSALRRRPVEPPVHTQPEVVDEAPLAPPEHPARARKEFEIGATFGITLPPVKENGQTKLDANGKPIARTRNVMGYASPTQWTPPIDETYVFPEEDTKLVLLALETKDRLLVHGHTGVGKTSLIEQVAARLNYSLVRINFDSSITKSDLIGDWIVKGREMTYMWGIMPLAMRMPGCIILLDEWDTVNSDCAFVLQRPLEKGGKLLVLGTGGTLVDLHEDNVIVATANTRGLGDDTGLYSHGTKVQNYSQLNRFGMTIALKYLPPEQEIRMLQTKFPDLKKAESTRLVEVISQVRKTYENGELSVPLSPRDLINWADKFIHLGSPMRAARCCFLNRMPPEDAAVVEGIVQRHFSPVPASPKP